MKLAFIGGGNMARAIIGGLVAKGTRAADIVVVEVDAIARLRLVSEFGVAAVEKPGAELSRVEMAIFAVKPQNMREAALAAAPHFTDPLIVTIAAGIRLDDLSRWLGGLERLVRAMPNTPALVHAGVTGLYAPTVVGTADRAAAEALMAAVGAALWFENESDLATPWRRWRARRAASGFPTGPRARWRSGLSSAPPSSPSSAARTPRRFARRSPRRAAPPSAPSKSSRATR